MKTVLKVLGGVLALVVLVVGGFLLKVQLTGIPSYPVQKVDLKVEVTPERVARGRKLASMLCAECHLSTVTGKLTGKDMAIPQFGDIWSLNITQHPTAGIGGWSDGELAFLLRTGIAKDGRYTPPWMAKLPHMADEDLLSIIAFLRSDDPTVAASPEKNHVNVPSMLSKVLTNTVFKPFAYPTQKIEAPPMSDTVAYGRYLVHNLDCYTCHSSDFAKVDYFDPPKSDRYLGGGNEIEDGAGGTRPSANITPDVETGIGSWSEEQFVRALRHGVRPDQKPIRLPMEAYPGLTDDEAKAIWAYLKTVPAISYRVRETPPGAPPSGASQGKQVYFKYYCHGCHSETGKGMCDLTKTKHSFASDDELKAFILKPYSKYPQTRMPSWEGVIPDGELDQLVQFVRTLDHT